MPTLGLAQLLGGEEVAKIPPLLSHRNGARGGWKPSMELGA